MIKIQAGLIPGIFQTLDYMGTQQLPFKTTYWIRRFLVKLDPEAKAFNETRMKILEEHVERDEGGNLKTDGDRYVLQDEAAFAQQYGPLAMQEIEIPFDKIAIKMEQLEQIDISVVQLNFLEHVMDIEGLDGEEPEDEEDAPIMELVPKKE